MINSSSHRPGSYERLIKGDTYASRWTEYRVTDHQYNLFDATRTGVDIVKRAAGGEGSLPGRLAIVERPGYPLGLLGLDHLMGVRLLPTLGGDEALKVLGDENDELVAFVVPQGARRLAETLRSSPYIDEYNRALRRRADIAITDLAAAGIEVGIEWLGTSNGSGSEGEDSYEFFLIPNSDWE